jgi:hypothetical protein
MRAFGTGWLFLCGLLAMGGVFLGAQETPPVLVSSVEALLDGDHGRIPFLLKHRKEALRLLAGSLQSRSIPLDQLLPSLGAEEYGEREEATMMLIRMGKPIHPRVKAHRDASINDPEVVYRCDLILEAPEGSAKRVEDLAVMRFLLELEDPAPEELLLFSEVFHRVMTSKTPGIFGENDQENGHRSSLRFLRLWANLPEGQASILEWLDGAKFSDAEILSDGAQPLRLLLLFDPEFIGKLTDPHRRRLYTLHSKTHESTSSLSLLIQRVQNPAAAWILLRMAADYYFKPETFDLLFKHLEQMPNEVFLEYVQQDAPMALDLIRELGRRRKELREPLASLLREKLLGEGYCRNLEKTFHVARNEFGIVFAEGDLDRAWQRYLEEFHSRSNEFKPEGMAWALANIFRPARAMKISPDLLLRHLQADGAIMVQGSTDSYLIPPLMWLLESPRDHIRQATMEWIVRDVPEEGYTFSRVLDLRAALFKDVSGDSGITPELRLQAFARLRAKDIEETFLGSLRLGSGSEYCRNLLHVFVTNEKKLRAEFADESRGLAYVDLIFTLWRNPSLNSSQRSFLDRQLRRLLPEIRKDPGRNTEAVLVADMMRLDDPETNALLVDFLQETQKSTYFFDSLNLPNPQHARILPEVLKRATAADDAGRRMFKVAMMIDPEHPELRKRQEQILAGEAPPEDVTALMDVLFRLSREPKLSDLPPERLRQWFATDTPEAMKLTLQRLAFFREPDNRRALLRFLRPALSAILAGEANPDSFQMLFKHPFRDREEDIAAVVELLRSDSAHIQKAAVQTLCSMDQLPETLAAPLLETLQQQLSNSHRSTLLWALALTGRPLPDLPDGLTYTKDREAFCLANLHPSPAERERHLRRLLETFREEPEWWELKQIRLTRGFPEIIHPFMEDHLHRALYSDAEEDRPFHYGHVEQLILWIPDALPEAVALERLKRLLQDISDPGKKMGVYPGMTDTIFRVLEIRYPEHLADVKPLLKKLPYPCRITTEYRRFLSRIAQ